MRRTRRGCVLLLLGCALSAAAREFTLAEVLTLTVPVTEEKEWTVNEGRRDDALATFTGPTEGRWRVSFGLSREKVPTGLEVTDYTREAEKSLKALADFKVLSRKTGKLDGEKSREYLYTHTLKPSGQPPVPVTVRAYVALFNGYAYTLYFRAPSEVYEKYVKDFEALAKSLKWVKAEGEKRK